MATYSKVAEIFLAYFLVLALAVLVLHWFQSYEEVFFMSADVYSDLTIGLTLKNYPKMTHHMLKSAHCSRVMMW